MRVLHSPSRPTPVRAIMCLVVGAVLWPAGPVEAQVRGLRSRVARPSVGAQVVAGSVAWSTQDLSFRISVEVPEGHHAYIDKGDDGFLIPFSFSFPGLEEAGIAVEMTSAPLGVRDPRVRAQVLRGQADFSFRLVPAPQPPAGATAGLRYQICNDVSGICYPPKVVSIPVTTGSGGR